MSKTRPNHLLELKVSQTLGVVIQHTYGVRNPRGLLTLTRIPPRPIGGGRLKYGNAGTCTSRLDGVLDVALQLAKFIPKAKS